MRRLLYLLGGLLLSACAALPPSTPAPSADGLQARLAALDAWRLEGRLAVRHGRDGGQGLLYWQQQADGRYTLRLLDALGRQQLLIRGGAGEVSLQTRDGRQLQADSAEALMQQVLGWSVPLRPLRWWVRGLPAPEALAGPVRRSVPGSDGAPLAELDQGGWRIRYLRHARVDGLPLPALLSLQHDDALRLKLVIETWELPTS
ncbi:MAG TPA: outer membrane lipoprotein LolB [Chromatiales bacterium]|nr:outer membrane lipoprotein LolB [Chromatiales bacterium]